MDIFHPEESITIIKDGHKFTTYIDSYAEHLEEILCPFCNKPMFSIEETCIGQNSYMTYFTLSCKDCSFLFKGINDYYEFISKSDFIHHCVEKINLVTRK